MEKIGLYSNAESFYRLPQIIAVGNYLYLFDFSKKLKVFYLSQTIDALISFKNEYIIDVDTTESSFISFFYSQELKRLFLLVDQKFFEFSIENPENPSRISNFTLHNSGTYQAKFSENCLYILQNNLENIQIYCFGNSTSNFDLNKTKLSRIANKNISNISDLAIKNSTLFLCDPALGLIVFDILDQANIKLLLIDYQINIKNISIYENSLVIVRSFENQSGEEYAFFEEYFINSLNNEFLFRLNRNITLNTSQINDLFISNDYMFILQDNQLKIFRHSIPSKFVVNADDYLTSFFAKDIMALTMFKDDILVAVYGTKITIHHIKELLLKFVCKFNEKISTNFQYNLTFEVLTKTCKNSEEAIYFNDIFTYCNYSNHLNILVKLKEKEITKESIDAGIIAGVVVLSVFLIIMIIIFIYYYSNLKEKFKNLKQMKYENIKKDDFSYRGKNPGEQEEKKEDDKISMFVI